MPSRCTVMQQAFMIYICPDLPFGIDMRMLLNWIVSALSLLIVAYFVRGIHVDGFGAALIAAAVIGLVNATLGLFLKIITLPLIIVTFGIFWFVINAMVLILASSIVPGFHVNSFGSAFIGAIVLSLVSWVLHWLLLPPRPRTVE